MKIGYDIPVYVGGQSMNQWKYDGWRNGPNGEGWFRTTEPQTVDRKLLQDAVNIIETWHGIGINDTNRGLWKIYYNNSPEMKPIREALGPLHES